MSPQHPAAKLKCPTCYDILARGENDLMDEQELKAALARDNVEFRKILDDHRTCELELEKIRAKTPFGEAEALAERELKKRKLALKDRMYRIMAEYGKRP